MMWILALILRVSCVACVTNIILPAANFFLGLWNN